MAATDTIVGIVGAVLLAVVMVGVFAYEYSNAPAAAASSDTELQSHFRADYPALNATGDLNGNGVPNFKDGDMDGDGVANANDTATAVTKGFTGTMPAPTPPATAASAVEFPLHVEAGSVGASFTLYYNSTTPAPLPGLPTLNLEVLGNDVPASSPARAQPTGTMAVTVTLNTEALAPGDYVIRVSQTQPGPSTTFAVKAFLDYGAGHPGGAAHTHS
ncbi:MAG TPA: hypothetical protein VM241_03320 [Candidatus Thermoplasmatota archaeon]|nr:hypothetical protein [Candidatus Thermoplasmatota archaeon]